MTYYAGDPEMTITFPITDTTGGALAFPPAITATTAAGATAQITGEWLGAATTVGAATQRDLKIPLGTLAAGLWSLRLGGTGVQDFFVGNVVIS